MINFTLKSSKKQKEQPTQTTAITSGKTLFNEPARRDAIIRKLVAACGYKAGDKVVVHPDIKPNVYGEVEVLSICDSYYKLGKAEKWPEETDCPLIVHARSITKNQNFFCTTGYLIKVDNLVKV